MYGSEINCDSRIFKKKRPRKWLGPNFLICAKNIKWNWNFQEWGSGYPGDAVTKKFLRDNLDPVFGFPTIVRFSWSTAEKILNEKGVKVMLER